MNWFVLLFAAAWLPCFIVFATLDYLRLRLKKRPGRNPFRFSLLMLSGIAALFLTIARPFIAEQKTLRRERRITADRVQVVGGWSNIVGECRYLYSKTPREGAFYYSGKGQDFLVPLPNSIAALKPDVVEIHPTEYGARVFVQMFGRPDTDRYIPFYGFFVECSTNADQASIPTFQHRQGYVEKIADSVFEIY